MTVEPQDWFQEDVDNALALEWPGVNENSIIWEIGGYEGRWALQMAEKYNPFIYFFEPQDWAFEKAKEALAGYKTEMFQFALWTHQGTALLGDYERDGASLLKPEEKSQREVLLVDIYSFFIKHRIKQIDVCLLNIEGGEFVLLPYMIGMGMMPQIKYFWWQWHLFIPDVAEKCVRLQQMLEKTHEIMWDYGSSAQAWRRK